MRTRTLAAGLLAAGLALAGCSSSSGGGGTLSTKWKGPLDALASSGGVGACQDYSTTGCLTAMTSAAKAVGGILKDINQADAVAQYPTTVAALQKYAAANQDFSDAGCPGNPSAGTILSQCYGDASTVTVGVTDLFADMQADEAGAGGN
jgi:hypothetical protein